ncbi:bifunctional diaminohydroxyphosphoribosylaminopyrimidine deaminase/5-amino-6-(5-phosphoribosylamino)uracil reductase RibD [Acaricomes phytoseiuli]|nr:bifunctional diaminohydroxyphosphoribosylaminopyrimidine deaminase/5-amino-6-(5-phosphoribosylamino)uracil reductase RibD [Acaricomes phytoseiuli]MCW1249067.1 bifunctional diaminohydroxyphosphoribosylaminopyrimidine deaminase/5-amino-6-(5-phosphoribosylamino)uracil reductase RibD [Acaricomes phytoseiuli]
MPTNPGAGPAMGAPSASDERYRQAMQWAIQAAQTGVRGANPLVGAVLLGPDGELLATGAHQGAGTPHAEAEALAALQRAGGSAWGATLLVTLEPCRHHGRMPSCAEAIIRAGIATVVYAVADPHPEATGGAQRLREAGIEVIAGAAQNAASELNRRWFQAVRQERPYISLHLAQTLDGRIAAADGSSQWISDTASLALNHALRARVDAMLLGTGTVLTDNPRLSARDAEGQPLRKQPLRVVMGRRDIPETAAIRADDNWLQIPQHDPLTASRLLHRRGVRHLMVEGGAQISAAFLRADLVDELIVALAPTVLGAGVSGIGDLGITALADARHFGWDPLSPPQRAGADLLLTLIPQATGSSEETEVRHTKAQQQAKAEQQTKGQQQAKGHQRPAGNTPAEAEHA